VTAPAGQRPSGAAREDEQPDAAAREVGAPSPFEEDAPMPSRLVPPTPAAYNPSRPRERMRGVIAILLLAFLGVMVVIPWLMMLAGSPVIRDLNDLISRTFPPIVGLVGAVTGFYYGDRSR
jgi:hypothetical protein